jgi:hypothetical protein
VINNAGAAREVTIADWAAALASTTRAAMRPTAPSCQVSVSQLTGGFSEQELTEPGVTTVFDSVEHLREHLNATNLQDTASE